MKLLYLSLAHISFQYQFQYKMNIKHCKTSVKYSNPNLWKNKRWITLNGKRGHWFTYIRSLKDSCYVNLNLKRTSTDASSSLNWPEGSEVQHYAYQCKALTNTEVHLKYIRSPYVRYPLQTHTFNLLRRQPFILAYKHNFTYWLKQKQF